MVHILEYQLVFDYHDLKISERFPGNQKYDGLKLLIANRTGEELDLNSKDWKSLKAKYDRAVKKIKDNMRHPEKCIYRGFSPVKMFCSSNMYKNLFIKEKDNR